MAVPIADAAASGPNPQLSFNGAGILGTYSTNGPVDTDNAFFKDLGTNGRTCASCHVPSSAWSISPIEVAARFYSSQGNDPIFRLNDGAVSPRADVSSLAAKAAAYRLLLSKGLIRVGIGVPPNAEFELAAVDDPYHFASSAELSLFRRPLPSTNLPFISAVMWDGRETLQPITSTGTGPADTAALQFNLAQQALDATNGHAQASSSLTDAQQREIVRFEIGLFTAQAVSLAAGPLPGPVPLSRQRFFIGINDPLEPGFTPRSMTLFDDFDSSQSAARQQIERGQQVFNTKQIAISGVAGLNDVLGVATLPGTCTTCHNAPNVGNHSTSLPINIGLSDAARRTPDLPLYTLRNRATGAVVQTTDPGRALITGKWADIGKFKGPVLRGLVARAPYFHNGSAATLEQVVDVYATRFGIAFTAQEKADLVAFLRAL